MKKHTLLASFTLAALAAVCAVPVTVSAATTKGSVKFDENLTPFETILPGTYETEITPNEGTNGTAGALQINWVSDFDFGTVTRSDLTKTYNAKMTSYTQAAATKYIPQFVQVSDTRGAAGGFDLTVQMTDIFRTSTSQTLPNTRIQFLTAGKATNNILDQTTPDQNASAILTGVGYSGTEIEVPTTAAITVLKSTGSYGPGSISSLVFDSTYTSTKTYTSTDENASVRLFVPTSDNPQTNLDYEAELTWTLNATL